MAASPEDDQTMSDPECNHEDDGEGTCLGCGAQVVHISNTEIMHGPLRGIEKADAKRLLKLGIGYMEGAIYELISSYREPGDGVIHDMDIANEVRRMQRWIKRAKELAK
jgi:hypothetical protein